MMQEMESLTVGEPTFYDLKEPWMHAPADSAQESRAATWAAAATTFGPNSSASKSPSDTMPTEASSPSTPSTGAATPCAPAWISPVVSTYVAAAPSARPSRIAFPGGALLQRVTRTDAVGHVVVGPARLDDRDRQRLAAVGDGQVGGAPELLGQRAQHRAGQLAQHRLEPPGQREHPQPDVQPAARVAPGEPVLLQRRDEPVDHRAVDADLRGQRRDAQPVRRRRQRAQHPQPAVQGLRRLGGHAPRLAALLPDSLGPRGEFVR